MRLLREKKLLAQHQRNHCLTTSEELHRTTTGKVNKVHNDRTFYFIIPLYKGFLLFGAEINWQCQSCAVQYKYTAEVQLGNFRLATVWVTCLTWFYYQLPTQKA